MRSAGPSRAYLSYAGGATEAIEVRGSAVSPWTLAGSPFDSLDANLCHKPVQFRIFHRVSCRILHHAQGSPIDSLDANETGPDCPCRGSAASPRLLSCAGGGYITPLVPYLPYGTNGAAKAMELRGSAASPSTLVLGGGGPWARRKGPLRARARVCAAHARARTKTHGRACPGSRLRDRGRKDAGDCV